MLPDRYRGLAAKVAVTVILAAAVIIGLLYSGVVSNVLPRDVFFGN